MPGWNCYAKHGAWQECDALGVGARGVKASVRNRAVEFARLGTRWVAAWLRGDEMAHGASGKAQVTIALLGCPNGSRRQRFSPSIRLTQGSQSCARSRQR